MNDDQRASYLAGMIDMAAYRARLDGNEDLAQCIVDWYYESGEGTRTIVANLDAYRNHAAEAIITVLIEREYGDN
ncbi:MAG: hypothetical protein H6843_13895 [Rhodospirillaceae bacterium]|nr:hypothetical protein [Rhodospirillaceae bacterium]